jgi:hypothetical protein
MAFGENATVGGWRGAGTNGDAQMVIMHMSDGLTIPFFSAWWPIFAGTQFVAGVAVADTYSNGVNASDSCDTATFGTAVAQAYAKNPTQSVVSGYLNAISSTTEGGGCPDIYNSDLGAGYPGGFNGCGCFAIMTVSPYSYGLNVIWNENWLGLTAESSYQTGSIYENGWGYYNVQVSCNYNLNNSFVGGP